MKLPESHEELDKLSANPTGSICWICHQFESFDSQEPYLICFECGHVYHSFEELIYEYEVGVDWSWEGSPDDIPFCPMCLHDL